MKRKLKSDGQQFHQHQQNEQSLFFFSHWTQRKDHNYAGLYINIKWVSQKSQTNNSGIHNINFRFFTKNYAGLYINIKWVTQKSQTNNSGIHNKKTTNKSK
jgi:hypothetical protein